MITNDQKTSDDYKWLHMITNDYEGRYEWFGLTYLMTNDLLLVHIGIDEYNGSKQFNRVLPFLMTYDDVQMILGSSICKDICVFKDSWGLLV